MSVIGSNIIAGASGTVETGYQIARSLRFNSADSPTLTRTPASSGNRRTWTWSGWVKRSAAGGRQTIFGVGTGTNNGSWSVINFEDANLGWSTYLFGYKTSAVFRDFSAWYHIVVAIDTTQATAANRIKMYINGVEQIINSDGGTITQNDEYGVNTTNQHAIGYNGNLGGGAAYLSGYVTNVHFIDGQALTPSDFGQTDSATGVWVPKAYTGTYGTNGFWLKFDDNSNTTAATLGKDSSGNSNNWTPNNFSVTAGVGNDSLVDSPTNYGTDTGAGGEVRGNYATWNPLERYTDGSLANGNLDAATGTTEKRGNFWVSTGKWYFEITPTVNGGNSFLGIVKNASVYVAYDRLGRKWVNGTQSSYGATYTTNDVIGFALDADALTITFYKNGASQGAISITESGPYTFFGNNETTGSGSVTYVLNAGQRPFAYTAPSGFKALCTQNLPTPTIGTSSTTLADDYFNVVTYTGTGSSLSVTGVGFQPDLVWIKGRSGATDHALYDAVRGVQKQLESNTTTDETTETTGLTAFGTDGFTVGALAQLNTSTATYVGWNWKESTTSGFDIVTYTGNGANRTISHGLGVAPKMVIVKARTTAGTDTGWPVWHTGIANTNYLELNATTASTSGTTYWNSTSPTSSVFSVGTAAAVNTNNDTYVAYLFAEVTGFSKIGSYSGNGNADGVFVYCGFRPKFVMIKNASSGVQGWTIQNPANQNYNEINNYVLAQSANAETGTYGKIDFLSNGFKLRTSDPLVNGNADNHIFIAFAENPFNYSRAR